MKILKIMLFILSVVFYFGCSSNDLQPTSPAELAGIQPSITNLHFGDIFTKYSLILTNYESKEQEWQLSCEASWVSLSRLSGNTGSEPDTVIIQVSRTGLEETTHNTIIKLISNENEELNIYVSLNVPPNGTISSCIASDVRLEENHVVSLTAYSLPADGTFGCTVRLDSCSGDYSAEMLIMFESQLDNFLNGRSYNSRSTSFSNPGIYSLNSTSLDSGDYMVALVDNSMLGRLNIDSDEENDIFKFDMLFYFIHE